MVVEAGHGVAPGQAVEDVVAQRGQGGLAGAAFPHDPGRLALMIGEPVEDQVLFRAEVPEQGRLGDLRGGGDVGDGHLVEAAFQEQGDRDRRHGVVGALLLQFPQSHSRHRSIFETWLIL